MIAYENVTLRNMIERNAAWYGDQPAFICGDTRVTHAEFFDASKRIASALYRMGLRRQSRVGVLSTNSVEFCEVYGACESFGFIAATINFRFAAPEMVHPINDSGMEVLIFEGAFAPQIEAIRDKLDKVRYFVAIGECPPWAVSWKEFVESGDASGPPLPPPSLDDIVYLIYTSGTTGRPKGCMLPQSAEASMGQVIATCMQLAVSDRTLLVMPLFHIGAKAISLGQQWVGGAVHLHSAFDPAAMLRTIQEQKITALHMAPVMIQALIEAPGVEEADLSSVNTLLYSAAPMPPALLAKAMGKLGPIFQQMYGGTEGVGTILPTSEHRTDGSEKSLERLRSIGHPFIGTDMAIMDDDNRRLAPREIGEICIKGPSMMTGYWNNTVATIETIRDGWLHTGDMGFMDEDGYFFLVDRKKDVVISGGENVYSREVENAIAEHPAVSQAAVFGTPHEKWGEAVTAAVLLAPGQSLTAEELVAHCRTLIAGYKIPRRVYFVEELPVLPSGKVAKPVLREKFNALIAAEGG